MKIQIREQENQMHNAISDITGLHYNIMKRYLPKKIAFYDTYIPCLFHSLSFRIII